MPEYRNGRPTRAKVEAATVSTAIKNSSILPRTPDTLGDLDALAEHLRGVYVVQLVVSDAGHRRTNYYKNLDAAQRAVGRARERGRHAHLTLVQMIPVGVIGGEVR